MQATDSYDKEHISRPSMSRILNGDWMEPVYSLLANMSVRHPLINVDKLLPHSGIHPIPAVFLRAIYELHPRNNNLRHVLYTNTNVYITGLKLI